MGPGESYRLAHLCRLILHHMKTGYNHLRYTWFFLPGLEPIRLDSCGMLCCRLSDRDRVAEIWILHLFSHENDEDVASSPDLPRVSFLYASQRLNRYDCYLIEVADVVLHRPFNFYLRVRRYVYYWGYRLEERCGGYW